MRLHYLREEFSAGIFRAGWLGPRTLDWRRTKQKKVVEGIVKYLNAKHQLVYGNDEYVDRFIIAARYLGLQDKIRNRIASRQQKAAYEAAQAAKVPAPRGGIGSTVAAIGVAMAAMGLASLSSLDDIGKK